MRMDHIIEKRVRTQEKPGMPKRLKDWWESEIVVFSRKEAMYNMTVANVPAHVKVMHFD